MASKFGRAGNMPGGFPGMMGGFPGMPGGFPGMPGAPGAGAPKPKPQDDVGLD